MKGHECYTTEPLFYTYRDILIEKRMKIPSPINKEIWKTVLTSNQKKIIFRVSNYQSLGIKLRGLRMQGKQHSKVKSDSENTLADCSKETHRLGKNEKELKHFSSSQHCALGP